MFTIDEHASVAMKRTIASSPLFVRRTKPRRDCNVEVRSLDDLPNEILCQILSFMPSKSAARMNVLSRRWRWLSAEVDDLDLVLDDFSRHRCRDLSRSDKQAPDAVAALGDFVSRSVLRRQGRAIRSLQLSFSTLRHDHPAYAWVASATCGGLLKELRLNISSESVDDHLQLPDMLFACPSLKALRLSNMELLQPLCFTGLKSLCLHKVGFVTELYKPPDDGAWDKRKPWELLCPSVLEELTLDSCKSDGPNLRIKSPTLRSLFIKGPTSFESIYVDAEKLQELRVCFWLGRRLHVSARRVENFEWVQSVVDSIRFRPNSISASTRAAVSITCMDAAERSLWRSLIKILHVINGIGTLALNNFCMQLLSSDHEESVSNIPIFLNVRQLMLHAPMNDGYNQMLITLLHECPRLEVLMIKHTNVSKLSSSNRSQSSFSEKNVEKYGRMLRLDYLPECLKEVEILNFTCSTNEFEIVYFLLQRLVALEKMIVHVARDRYAAKHKRQARKILRFPRVSSCVKISIL